MVDRILLDSSGLKVSQPGVPVLSAGFSQLQFSSDFSAIGLFSTNVFALNWSFFGANSGTFSTTINYGKSYATPPLIWFYADYGSYMVPIGNTNGVAYVRMDNSLPGQPRMFYISVVVNESNFTVYARFEKQTDGWPVPYLNIRYFIFEYGA